MERFRTSLRRTLRRLGRQPALSLAALGCLALGLGASAAIFAVAELALLRPLPFAEPERLVTFHDQKRLDNGQLDTFRVSPPLFAAWKEHSPAFEQLGAAQPNFGILTGDLEPQRLRIAEVTQGLLPALGVKPLLGRLFLPEEDTPRSPARVVVLSYRLWQQAFAGNPAILGRSIVLDDLSHTVVGVMPPEVRYPEGVEQPDGTDLWKPFGLDPQQLPQRLWHNLLVIGRLAPGVSLEQGRRSIEQVTQSLAASDPESFKDWQVQAVGLRQDLLGNLRPALLLLLGAAALLFAIACVNVANLQLARSAARQEEFAIRLAVGESRQAQELDLLLEGLVLALVGGGLGLALAGWGLGPLLAMVPSRTSFFSQPSLGPRVLAFTLVLCLVAALAVSLPSVLRLRFQHRQPLPKVSGRREVGSRRTRIFQSALVVAEVALATLLLAACGLTLQSFLNLRRVNPGFSLEGKLDLGTVFSPARYPAVPERMALLEQASQAIAKLPGVERVEIASGLPLGDSQLRVRISIEDRPPSSEEVLAVNHRLVSPGYFELMGIRLARGRFFDATDTSGSTPVAIVSEETARRYWPGQDPLGKRVKRGARDAPNGWRTVVGVVSDVRDRGLGEDFEPTWYLPAGQELFPVYHFVVKTAGEPTAMLPAVRQAIWSVDRQLPLYGVRSLEALRRAALGNARFNTALLALFTGAALLLVLAGLYGVLSSFVAQSLGEIGVRMALGAQRPSVLGMVLRRAATWSALGIGLGLGLTVLASRFLTGFLFQIPATNPATLSTVVLALVATSLLIALVPAVRATRIDPLKTLRAE